MNWVRAIAASLSGQRDVGQSAETSRDGNQAGDATAASCSLLLQNPTSSTVIAPCSTTHDGKTPAKKNEDLLLEAIKLVRVGSVRELRHLLKESSELSVLLSLRDHDGYTLLQRAVMNNQLKVTRYLVEIGADLNGPICGRPLHMAARLGMANMVELLLQLGADPNVLSAVCHPDKHASLYLTYSATAEKWGPVCEGDLYRPDHCQKQTFEYPAYYAVLSNDMKTMQTLLLKKVIKVHRYKPWLHLACELGASNLVPLFFSKSTEDINLVDEDGFTPLMYAVQNKHTDIAEYLVMNGGLTFVKSPAEDSLLHLAVRRQELGAHGMSHMVEYLLKCGLGMYVNATNSSGSTALNELLIYSNLHYEGNLLKSHAGTHEIAMSSKSLAAVTRHEIVSTCRHLLNAGTNPNIPDKQGNTSLNAANSMLVQSGGVGTGTLDTYLELLRQLLSKGANPRLPNHCGQCGPEEFLRSAVSELYIPVSDCQTWSQLVTDQKMDRIIEGLKLYKAAGADFATSSCLIHWTLVLPFADFCWCMEFSRNADGLFSEEILSETDSILQAYRKLFHALVVDCECPIVHCHHQYSDFSTLYYRLVTGEVPLMKLWKSMFHLFIYLGFDLNEKVTVVKLSNFETFPNNINYGAPPIQHLFYLLLVCDSYTPDIREELKKLIVMMISCMELELVRACLKAVLFYINTRGFREKRTLDINDFANKLLFEPRTLQNICRTSIYNSMHKKLYLVDSLPLPVALKTYLTFSCKLFSF